jgi:hypothetical protein
MLIVCTDLAVCRNFVFNREFKDVVVAAATANFHIRPFRYVLML